MSFSYRYIPTCLKYNLEEAKTKCLNMVMLNPLSYNDDINDIYNADNSVGKILNTNLQLSLFLKIDTKIMEFNDLNSEII